ncbi:polysaccharide biosynthesis protein [Terribacillus sp. 179-K 1B1 HS]|uniref:putative polysaccharide biosynthesis protein n=1 Tax=Terribacillus sp. 179-K 1B1 HS TaxID=3142388 RepID=UPI00399EFF9B
MGLGMKRLFHGAFVLAVAGLISKILSAGYRVPFQNIVGDKGFYIYQQVYPFLGIAASLALYGIPAAVSRLVAERYRNVSPSLRSFYLPIGTFLFGLAVITFALLYITAPQIADLMGDAALEKPLRAAAYIFLAVPFTSILRGVYQGKQNMTPTAVSQVVEQIVRVGLILVVTFLLVRTGSDLYDIGAKAALASLVGACFGIVVLGMYMRKQPIISTVEQRLSWIYIIKTILVYGFFICLNYMLLLLLQFADAFTLVSGLLDHGLGLDAAREWKGIYDRGQPLVQLGIVVGSSLALAFVPSITKKQLKSEKKAVIKLMQSGWKLSFLLSIAAAAGLIILFPLINELLFKADVGTYSLQVFMLTIFVCSLTLTTASMLETLGKWKQTAVIIAVGFLLKWFLNEWLVPIYGIMGASLATVITVACILAGNLYLLKRYLPEIKLFQLPWKSLIVGLLSMLVAVGLFYIAAVELFHVKTRILLLIYVLFAVLVGAAVYGITLIRTGAFSRTELVSLPFSKRLLGLEGRNKK